MEREDRLRRRTREVIDELMDADRIHILAHSDADGISSAAIVARALMKLETPFDVRIVEIDSEEIKRTYESRKRSGGVRLFLDLSSDPKLFKDVERAIVIDHHPFKERPKGILLNPREIGKNVSTSVLAYHVARRIDPGAYRYSHLPLVGSRSDGTLDNEEPMIAEIIKEAEERGIIKVEKGRLIFDENRPLADIIASIVPKDSSFYRNESLVREELRRLNISAESLKALTERDKLLIQEHFGIKNEIIYRILKESAPMLKTVHEFATLLNACSKSGYPYLALTLALGDKSVYDQAYNVYIRYRTSLGRLLRDKSKRMEYKNLLLYFLDEHDHKKASTIATLLSKRYKNKTIVVIGKNGSKYRISVRGRNVYYAVRRAAELVGGEGGGHENAAGASIPVDKLDLFLDTLSNFLSRRSRKRRIDRY